MRPTCCACVNVCQVRRVTRLRARFNLHTARQSQPAIAWPNGVAKVRTPHNHGRDGKVCDEACLAWLVLKQGESCMHHHQERNELQSMAKLQLHSAHSITIKRVAHQTSTTLHGRTIVDTRSKWCVCSGDGGGRGSGVKGVWNGPRPQPHPPAATSVAGSKIQHECTA